MKYLTIPAELLSSSRTLDGDIKRILSQLECPGILTFQIFGNTWEPVARWLRMDSRIFSPTTYSNRLSTWDIESLAEINDLKLVKWDATKLTPFATSLIPSGMRNALRRLPGMRQFAFKVELAFRSVKGNVSVISATSPGVSIVLPARNESGNEHLIRLALDQIIEYLPASEVVLVEGNSTDNTWSMLEGIVSDYDQRLRISLIKQSGKGKKNAVVSGFAKADGDTLAIIDTDFTVDIRDSIKAIYLAQEMPCCFVNCTRTVYPMERDAMRWANYIGNRLFAMLTSCLLAQKVSDSLCGTKVFSRHLYEAMIADGTWLSPADPFGDFTILFGASKYKYKIVNYPVRYKSRVSGSPNISRWIDGLRLVRVCWHYFLSA